MADDPEAILILGAGESSPVPGAEQVTAACGHPGWMSPSSRAFDRSGTKVQILCLRCGLARAAADPDPRFEVIPGQVEEFREGLKRLFAEKPDA